MRKLILIGLCLLLAGAAFAADRTVVVTPVTGNIQSLNPAGANGVCQLGNLNAPAWAITDWIWGDETYKYIFDADQALCTQCPAGFKVEMVHFYMQFGAEDVPTSFDCMVDFEETVWDEASGCFMPGPTICESQPYTVTIDQAGLYDIALPLPYDVCDCAYFGYKYALGLTFLTPFDSTPDAITDDIPVGCTSWNDYGMGWYDLVTGFGFPGEIIMFADIICCENPVDTEKDTWGGVKSLFR